MFNRELAIDLSGVGRIIPTQLGISRPTLTRATLTKNNHAWVEIEVDNQWYFFDPTNYYAHKIMKLETYNNTWFGKPEQYSTFSANQIRSIVDANTRENVIERYPQLKKETKIIIKSINQKKFEGISIPNSTEIIKLVNKHSS